MNLQQKILTWVALGLFALSVISAPWNVVQKSYEGHVVRAYMCYYPVFWSPPSPQRGEQATLAWEAVVCTWAAIGVAYAALFFLLRTPKPK